MSILSGSLDLNGNITASGDLRFPNVGSSVIRPINILTPTGTGSFSSIPNAISTNTTTYLQYGINVVRTSSIGTGSYCCRLPQTPQKGKNVTIINNDGANLYVFPSTASGDINGQIDGYFIVPSDGKAYSFDCYENPLPGGWASGPLPYSSNTLITTNTITFDASTTNNKLAFVNDSIKAQGAGTISLSADQAYAQQGISTSNPIQCGVFTLGNNVGSYILPPIPWQTIQNISVSTNLSGSSNINVLLMLMSTTYVQGFVAGTNTPASAGDSSNYVNALNAWTSQNIGTTNPAGYTGLPFGAGQFVSPGDSTYSLLGTFTPSATNPNVSNTAGEPGTKYINWNINPNELGAGITKKIGKFYITTIPNVYQWSGPLANTYVNVDVYWYHALSPILYCPNNINGVKFKARFQVTL